MKISALKNAYAILLWKVTRFLATTFYEEFTINASGIQWKSAPECHGYARWHNHEKARPTPMCEQGTCTYFSLISFRQFLGKRRGYMQKLIFLHSFHSFQAFYFLMDIYWPNNLTFFFGIWELPAKKLELFHAFWCSLTQLKPFDSKVLIRRKKDAEKKCRDHCCLCANCNLTAKSSGVGLSSSRLVAC